MTAKYSCRVRRKPTTCSRAASASCPSTRTGVGVVGAGQRHPGGAARHHHARQGAQPGEELAIEHPPRIGAGQPVGHAHLQREDVIRFEAGVEREHRGQAAGEQAGLHCQHRGERHLPDDQRGAQSAARRRRPGDASTGILQHRAHVGPGGGPHRREADEAAGRRRRARRRRRPPSHRGPRRRSAAASAAPGRPGRRRSNAPPALRRRRRPSPAARLRPGPAAPVGRCSRRARHAPPARAAAPGCARASDWRR